MYAGKGNFAQFMAMNDLLIYILGADKGYLVECKSAPLLLREKRLHTLVRGV